MTERTNLEGSQSSLPTNIRTAAHDWVRPIHIRDNLLVDDLGRTLLLRGVNMSGNSKLPLFPPGSAHHTSPRFFDHRNVSFVGRPVPLHEAELHFSRLRSWGLTFIRLVCPWEALEHQGPGIYDQEYINYLIQLLKIASKFGIKCFIDPHQDTWSRFSGGSGAPGWTFEVVGLDVTRLEQVGAVVYHDFSNKDFEGKMVWPTNYTKAASATLFTCFFAGNVFCPKSMYQGEHVQDFLQRHYYACYEYLAKRLRGLHAVVGFEAMNEPHPGYIGMEDITSFDQMKDLHLGHSPTPLQGWALASGMKQNVDYYIKSWPWPSRKVGTRPLNEEEISAILPGRECVWKENGVWTVNADNQPVLLKPNHFAKLEDGSDCDFYRDFYGPFLKNFCGAIRRGNPEAFFFFEPIPNQDPPVIVDQDWHTNTIYSPHWYDLKAVFQKSFDSFFTHDVQGLSRGKNLLQASYFGLYGAKKNYTLQIGNVVKAGLQKVGVKPCLIGECGIPMDINQKRAFETGDYTHHTNFLDAVITALEANLVHFTLWNYNPLNTNDHGDHWNGEDFSIFSKQAVEEAAEALKAHENARDEEREHSLHPGPRSPTSPMSRRSSISSYAPHTPFDISDLIYAPPDEGHHIGGRALDAVIRPYASKMAGIPLKMGFQLSNLSFEVSFYTPRMQLSAPTSKEGLESPVHDLDGKKAPSLPRVVSEQTSEEIASNTTEIYVPQFHYKQWEDFEVTVSDGVWLYDAQKETIYWTIDPRQQVQAQPVKTWFGTIPVDETKNIHTLRITRILKKTAKKGYFW
ncbi:glycoside hydrolase superfamily [Gorgonomyces haynaldii]|nr:glycoside hydrolase superfamily [Gorgonomyces haynaldii]